MNDLSIALDMENTIAATQYAFIQRYNRENGTDYTLYDIDSWDWVREEIDFDYFMETVDDLWREVPFFISPTEVGLPTSVSVLSEIGNVDIVTQRVGVEEGMSIWLDQIGISDYRNIVSTDESKAELGYDFYIDDNPNLYHELDWKDRLFLIKRPYNPHLWEKNDLTAVGTVRESVIELQEIQ